MRIVVLDGHTMNPGDLSWDELNHLGDSSIFERSSPAETLSRLAGAEAALTNKVIIDRAAMEKLPDLRYIGVTATGYNVVDVQAAKERGIVVTNVPAYSTDSVAQMVFALLLELANRAGHHAQTVRDGLWSQSPDFCYWDYPLVELSGRTLGIIGFGRIGQKTAEIARAFGMQVLVFQPRPKPLPEGVHAVSLEVLLQEADVVSLHCPLTPETRELINSDRIALMKREAFLINTSRGPLIVEEDLAEALASGRIAGACLDVLASEPPPADHPLYTAPNCYITPHIAWATRASRQRLMKVTVQNLRSFLSGQPINVVSG